MSVAYESVKPNREFEKVVAGYLDGTLHCKICL
jgi:hypothetical protein